MTHVAGQATAEDSPVLHAATGLAEQIRAASDETESGRRIPPGIAAAKKDAGVFGMAMPRGSGGPELDALTQFRVIEVLAMAEGSAGWCAMIGRDGAYITALLDQGVARTMYPDLLGGHRRGCYDASHPDPFAVMAPQGRNDSEARPGYPACLGKPRRYSASFGDHGHAGRRGGVFTIDCCERRSTGSGSAGRQVRSPGYWPSAIGR
jgi:acyl-CoA dehydrogenase-like protein